MGKVCVLSEKDIDMIATALIPINSDTDNEHHHNKSIMSFKVVHGCDHDPGYMCEHRAKWLIDFLNSKIV